MGAQDTIEVDQERVDQELQGHGEPDKQQLDEYEQELNYSIQILEEQVELMQMHARLAREVDMETESKVQWLEYLMKSVADLKKERGRIRALRSGDAPRQR